MKTYTIMVVDDEYTLREQQYQAFLEEEYDGIDVRFKIIPLEYGREIFSVLPSCSKDIDAFFIDAQLDEIKTGWGAEYNASFDGLLFQLEKIYRDSCVPPIFMISKHWQDKGGLLTYVNKAFSVFHNPLHASRYYNQVELESVVQEAQTRNSRGKLKIETLLDERKYIENEILKTRGSKYNSSMPVDAVLQVAVPDEKKQVYQFLHLSEENDQYLKPYALSYQEVDYQGMHIVVVSQTFMGMTEASRTGTAAILAFHPKVIMMAGICAGKKNETKLGDLIVADRAFDYSTGKMYETGLEHRPPHRPINDALAAFVNNAWINHSDLIFAKVNEKFNGKPLSECKIRFTSMASGPWVVNTETIFDDIRDHIVGNCISLDMEAYAVALAADQLKTPWIIVKSVQDYADGKKSEAEKDSRAYAAFSSVYLLCEYLPKMIEYIN